MLFFLILFILNIILIIFFDKFSRFVNLFDIPDGLRKLHKQPIASIGGVIIYINLFFYFIYTQYRYFNFNIDNPYFTNFDFIIFFITASIFFFIGYFDDKFNLNPNLKLFLDGSLIATDTLATIPTCSQVYIGASGTTVSAQAINVNNNILYKTALTDTECITLTTL